MLSSEGNHHLLHGWHLAPRHTEQPPAAQCQTRDAQGRSRRNQLSLPDVDAAEHPEDQSQDERHGHGQQGGQQAVEDEFDQLERREAPDPHFVEAVRGDGLRDDIFETNLSDHAHTHTHARMWTD